MEAEGLAFIFYVPVLSARHHTNVLVSSFQGNLWCWGLWTTRMESLRKRGKKKEVSIITNLTSIHADASLIPGLAQWIKDLALL